VTAGVQQHIGERVSDLARRAQHVQVVTIHQNRTGAAEHAVHSASEARSERLHAAAKCRLIICFDDEVCVIALQ
jgi:hypothetical protein